MKKIEVELEKQWVNIHMQTKPLPSKIRASLLPVMILHKNMFTFVQNLQYYLHVIYSNNIFLVTL